MHRVYTLAILQLNVQTLYLKTLIRQVLDLHCIAKTHVKWWERWSNRQQSHVYTLLFLSFKCLSLHTLWTTALKLGQITNIKYCETLLHVTGFIYLFALKDESGNLNNLAGTFVGVWTGLKISASNHQKSQMCTILLVDFSLAIFSQVLSTGVNFLSKF